jgi:hypothetical protein
MLSRARRLGQVYRSTEHLRSILANADTLTARALLTALASFKKGLDRVQQWYVELASVLLQEDGQASKAGAGAQ